MGLDTGIDAVLTRLGVRDARTYQYPEYVDVARDVIPLLVHRFCRGSNHLANTGQRRVTYGAVDLPEASDAWLPVFMQHNRESMVVMCVHPDSKYMGKLLTLRLRPQRQVFPMPPQNSHDDDDGLVTDDDDDTDDVIGLDALEVTTVEEFKERLLRIRSGRPQA